MTTIQSVTPLATLAVDDADIIQAYLEGIQQTEMEIWRMFHRQTVELLDTAARLKAAEQVERELRQELKAVRCGRDLLLASYEELIGEGQCATAK